MTDDEGRATLGEVVGENLRRLRGERRLTQAQAADLVRRSGLIWGNDHVFSVEAGRRQSVEPEALVLLSAAFDVPMSAWFEGEGDVVLSPEVVIERRRMREEVLTGGRVLPVAVDGVALSASIADVHYVPDPHAEPATFEADFKASGRLGLPMGDTVAAARELFGRSLTEERDRRLGDLSETPMRSVQAKRGAMTRGLIRELAEHLGVELRPEPRR